MLQITHLDDTCTFQGKFWQNAEERNCQPIMKPCKQAIFQHLYAQKNCRIGDISQLHRHTFQTTQDFVSKEKICATFAKQPSTTNSLSQEQNNVNVCT